MPAFIPCLAEANIWANLGVLLLIGGFILIGKLMDYLKGKFEQATKKSAESPAERKIRKVIEQSRTRQPGNYRKQGQPEHPMHRQHVPAVSPKQQDAYSTPGAIPPPVASGNVSNSEEQAAASIQSLSNAEQEALASLQNKHATTPAAKHQTIHHASQPAATSATDLRHDLNNIQALRTAILYREILDKPVALRDTSR
ncbi:hypothetical protein QET93_000545 [Akkermansia sp. N21116]|jgi:hypothetical protein|uniref:hypothetical protein n=1 Tax=Akkermansia sp. N21116 TaxID=3040764 RepID=UPI00244EC2E8|nr:hypothetical protein [Akkermansia sp. N21116]WPX40589.1 hypothetical protein QET93_000545 [Akkermansia sp. N21116]